MRQGKRNIVFVILVLIAIISLFGCRVADDPTPEEPKEDTISQVALFDPGAFEDPNSCKGCHSEIYQAWEGSMHAYAWTSEFYQHDYLQAHQETEGATDMFCGACHAPIAARTGLLPPADGSKFDAVSEKGVSCDFCHTITEVKEIHNMQNVSEPGTIKRGPKGDGQSGYHDIQQSDLYRSAEFCGACHNVTHPSSGVGVITTYDEWKESTYADEGIVCQDCHMTPTPGVTSNPGKSAIMGKERDHVATHYFEGGSSFSFMQQGSDTHAEMAVERLKAAATIDVKGNRTDTGIDFTVEVTNVGAGHNIPTGVSYIRKMWLEVIVTNEQGEIVYQSGYANEDNTIDSEAVFYRKLFKDAEGNLTSKGWLAEGIGYERRIAANATDTERYLVEAAGQSFDIQARLLYRSFSQDNMYRVMGDQAPHIDSVEMASTTITIQ